jgi:hypothetical protein
MKKGRAFQKDSTLSGNSYYEKEEGIPYSFAQLVYKFLIAYTGGNTKGIGNLNSAFEKAVATDELLITGKTGIILS